MIETLYLKDKKLYILNQKLLPHKIRYVLCTKYEQVADAIKTMVIRGAPAIGIAAGYGMMLASRQKRFNSYREMAHFLSTAKSVLAKTRPTAVNLFWALDRMFNLSGTTADVKKLQLLFYKEAVLIHNEDIETNKNISRYGASLLSTKSVIITHCNAGSLATGGIGTALGVITEAYRQKKVKMVYVDETRPYLQGARLTAFELASNKVPAMLICDNMAGFIMKTRKVDAVIVGADRITGNGDVANKIGTYQLAVLAKYHNVKFYVAAPYSTFDSRLHSGDDIVIEERSSEEVTCINGKRIVPYGFMACHPAFDVTPNELITGIITEKGILTRKYFRKK